MNYPRNYLIIRLQLMMFIKQFILVAVFAVLSVPEFTKGSLESTNTYYLEDGCGSKDALEIHLGSDEKSVAFLVLKKDSKLFSHEKEEYCNVNVFSQSNSNISFTFLNINLQCEDEALEITNDITHTNKSFCGRGVCKNDSCPGYQMTTNDEVDITFYGNMSKVRNSYFTLMMTKFDIADNTGTCPLHSQYHCNNGRCIWSGLKCDKYYHCGDGSDEKTDCSEPVVSTKDTIWGIVVIVFGVLATAILLPFFIFMAVKGGQTNIVTIPEFSKTSPSINDPEGSQPNTTWYVSEGAPSGSQTVQEIHPGVTSDTVHLLQP